MLIAIVATAVLLAFALVVWALWSWTHIWRSLASAVLVLVVGAAASAAYVSRPPDPGDAPDPTSHWRLVVLGDSYTSGEGARRYAQGTGVLGVNMCHRARTAWAYAVADAADAALTFPACSGAVTANVIGDARSPHPGPDRRVVLLRRPEDAAQPAHHRA